jgi:hypothetical protein
LGYVYSYLSAVDDPRNLEFIPSWNDTLIMIKDCGVSLMSIENDARECLIAAIEVELDQTLQPHDLNTAKPSDPDFKCNMVRWRHVLEEACSGLVRRGRKPGAPTNEMAKDLLDLPMSNSMRYLVRLCAKPRVDAPTLLVGVAAVVITVAFVAAYKANNAGDKR